VSFLQGVREHRDALLRGATLLVGGLALVVAGSLIGISDATWSQVAAGILAVTGIVVAFLGFFVYVLPPLLPAK
jgi:predicted anti-sigma-YlaC factor YlaD